MLIPTATACRRMGLSCGYIQRLMKTGRIEGGKLEHDWLLYEVSLLAFREHPRDRGRPKGQSHTHPEAPVSRNTPLLENKHVEH